MRILIFGDSVAQGYYDLDQGGWVNLLYLDTLVRKVRSTTYTTELFNLSVSGDDTRRVMQRLEAEIEGRRWQDDPIVLVFAVGLNDTRITNDVPFSSPEQYRNDLEELYAIATRHAQQVIFVGLPAVFEPESAPWKFNAGTDELSWTNERIEKFDKVLASFAKDKGASFVPIFDAYMRRQQNGETLHADGLHPDALGHRLIYEQVKAVMQ